MSPRNTGHRTEVGLQTRVANHPGCQSQSLQLSLAGRTIASLSRWLHVGEPSSTEYRTANQLQDLGRQESIHGISSKQGDRKYLLTVIAAAIEAVQRQMLADQVSKWCSCDGVIVGGSMVHKILWVDRGQAR
jgi:hypothetical protein